MIEIKEIKRNFRGMYLLIFSIFIVVTLSFMIQGSSEIVTNMNKEHYHKNGTFIFSDLKDDYDNYKNILKSKNIEDFELNLEFPKDIDTNIISEVSINEYFLVTIDSLELKYKDIIIPSIYALQNDLKVGDKIVIRNNELNIAGLSDDARNNAFSVNLETAELLKLKIDSLEIDVSDNMTDVEKNSYIEELSKELNSTPISNANYRSTFERTNAKMNIVILIAIFSMMSIYYYILSERKEKYYIFKFSGMTRYKFYKMLIIELIFIYVLSFILSLVLFYFVNSILLKEVFGILRYDLTLSSVIHVFIVFLVILLLFMTINISFYFKKSLVEGFKEVKQW